MSLPDHLVLVVYAKLAWGLVLAAMAAQALSLLNQQGVRRRLVLVIAVSMGLMWLPGAASPAYWLGLALQAPSSLLASYCLFALRRQLFNADETSGLPIIVAASLAIFGVILYADTFGFMAGNLYALGFKPVVIPLIAGLLSFVAVTAMWRRGSATIGWAVLFAVVLFHVSRLPTGNFFDVVLDPMIWFWSLGRLLTGAKKRRVNAMS